MQATIMKKKIKAKHIKKGQTMKTLQYGVRRNVNSL